MAFVIEGEPHDALLHDGEARELASGALPLENAVGKLAAAYDYDVERRGSVFLLRKRYTDPADLPGVTPEECAEAAGDVRRILARFHPRVPPQADPNWSALVGPLMASLSPEQLRAMGAKTLKVSDLSARQRAQARRFALFFYVQQPADAAEAAMSRLRGVAEADAALRWGEVGGHRVFGYEAPAAGGAAAKGRAPFFVPLSHPHLARESPYGGLIVASRRPGDPPPAPAVPDPTDPALLGAPAAPPRPEPPTIGQAVAALDARAGSAPRIAVDAVLGDKPLTVVGAESAPAPEVLAAIAQVYGLRVKKEKDGTLRLARRLYRTPATVADLPGALRRVLPEPLARAALASQGDGVAAKADALRTRAVRRLRHSAEPKVKASPNGRIRVSALDKPARSAFAVVLMANCLRHAGRFIQDPAPPYIARFEEAHLTGGLFEQEGRQMFAMFLQTPIPGREELRLGPGVTNVLYTPRSKR